MGTHAQNCLNNMSLKTYPCHALHDCTVQCESHEIMFIENYHEDSEMVRWEQGEDTDNPELPQNICNLKILQINKPPMIHHKK